MRTANRVMHQNWETAKISVIIPMLNEETNIELAIASTRSAPAVEVIAVDGGSADGTVALAKSLGATVLSTTTGRARQMNAGAKAATGEILLFLHADTRLPVGFADLVRAALASEGAVVAGAFSLKIDGAPRLLRWIERGVNWRSRLFQLPYGDQAIFLRADTFDKAGGFPEQPIMEDFELVRRLQRSGKIAIVPEPAVTSARRWLQSGVFATTLVNQLVILGYLLGCDRERLRQLYRRKKYWRF
ncbi:TIGR04283 family arsenosugar biosynthesis glycosyltransferase [Altericista sp. CCNU0014]|uniref:TIGR04283 family arsenosugar biosynthesis glycosyltransferase n=1 Tax=Altericista sp. CCNU0014 TaxID=3082949 RepID=UPI003850C8EE